MIPLRTFPSPNKKKSGSLERAVPSFPLHDPSHFSLEAHNTMGGLRALCCSKGDKADDSQLPPARPAQPRPEKSTQNGPPSAKKATSSTDVTPGNLTPGEPAQEKSVQQNPVPRDLWKEAFDNLDPSRQPYVAANGMSSTFAIDQVIKDTTAKYELWQKGGLKIRRKDGDDINIRDCAERVLGAAMKASNVISTAVSFDPTGHASSAWMVVSFGMSVIFLTSSDLYITNTYSATDCPKQTRPSGRHFRCLGIPCGNSLLLYLDRYELPKPEGPN